MCGFLGYVQTPLQSLLLWSPTGKLVVPFNRPCGATSPVWRRDRPSKDGAFLPPVRIGGSPAAGVKGGKR